MRQRGGGDFCHITPLQLRGLFAFLTLRFYETFTKTIFLIITPDESHLCQKRQFCASANGGRISSIFPPAQITRDFRFFRFYGFTGICWELISESSLPTGRILCENDNFAQSPTLGRFLPDFRPLQLRGLCAFPILRLYGTSPKLFPEPSLPMSHIFVRNDNLAQAPTVGGFLSDFRQLQLRGLFLNYFPNLHYRRVTSWSKTTISRKRRRWDDFCQILARCNYAGFRLSILRLYGTFPESIF